MSNSAVTAANVETANIVVRKPRRVPLSLIIGGGIVAFFLVLAIIGPHVTPYPFDQFHFKHRMVGPSEEFWLGTDRYGRDIFSRVVAGARLTVFMAGTGTLDRGLRRGADRDVLGLHGGMGGRDPDALHRHRDVLSGSAAGDAGGCGARCERGQRDDLHRHRIRAEGRTGGAKRHARPLRHVQFVEAAQVRGESRRFIISARSCPTSGHRSSSRPASASATRCSWWSRSATLGLGAQPPAPDWGLMIAKERAFMVTAPWVVFAPPQRSSP